MEIIQFDVKTAFLYGDLLENTWIELPPGPWHEDKRVVKLKKSLYGLKSPHCWNDKLDGVLSTFNLQKSDADDCIYKGTCGTDTIYIALYVDNGLVSSKSAASINKFLRQLSKVFEIKVNYPSCFVGFEIERDREKGELKIHQERYLRKLLERFKMDDAKGVAVPVDPYVRLSKEMCQKNDTEMKNIPHASLIGYLQFATNVTRYDIAFGVNLLSRYLQKPGIEHWKMAKHILRYLKDTATESIIYKIGKKNQESIGYCDADFAGDEDERRSTSGL